MMTLKIILVVVVLPVSLAYTMAIFIMSSSEKRRAATRAVPAVAITQYAVRRD